MDRLLDRMCRRAGKLFGSTKLNYIMCGMALGALFIWITVQVVQHMAQPPEGSAAYLPYVTGLAGMVAFLLTCVMLGLYKRDFKVKASREGVDVEVGTKITTETTVTNTPVEVPEGD